MADELQGKSPDTGTNESIDHGRRGRLTSKPVLPSAATLVDGSSAARQGDRQSEANSMAATTSASTAPMPAYQAAPALSAGGGTTSTQPTAQQAQARHQAMLQHQQWQLHMHHQLQLQQQRQAQQATTAATLPAAVRAPFYLPVPPQIAVLNPASGPSLGPSGATVGMSPSVTAVQRYQQQVAMYEHFRCAAQQMGLSGMSAYHSAAPPGVPHLAAPVPYPQIPPVVQHSGETPPTLPGWAPPPPGVGAPPPPAVPAKGAVKTRRRKRRAANEELGSGGKSGNASDGGTNPGRGRKRIKRRPKASDAERAILEASFEKEWWPDKATRDRLMAQLGWKTERSVLMWFQNKRRATKAKWQENHPGEPIPDWMFTRRKRNAHLEETS